MSTKTHDNDQVPEPDLLLWPDVHFMVRLSRPTIHRMIAAGKFPRPIRLGAGRSAWLRREVTAWLEARISERDQSAG